MGCEGAMMWIGFKWLSIGPSGGLRNNLSGAHKKA